MSMRRKRNPIKRIIYLLGAIFIFGLGYLWWHFSIKPVDSATKGDITFTIEKGSGLKQIASDLKSEGLIRNTNAFLLAVKILGIENNVQAGDFSLSPSMSTITIAENLTSGKNEVRITIPEGKRAEEIAALFAEKLINVDIEEWETKLSENEGYLFPDTYNVNKDINIDEVVTMMKANFESKYSSITVSRSLTKDEIVKIASLVEREARHSQDRPLVASVIYNRLNIGMKLDIDATVQYALGFNSINNSWWKHGLSLEDLQIDSPYNTYTNAGLPPTPISNPGLAALDAAANPADTNYFYYITDSEGVNRYARTLAEHNANIARYGL